MQAISIEREVESRLLYLNQRIFICTDLGNLHSTALKITSVFLDREMLPTIFFLLVIFSPYSPSHPTQFPPVNPWRGFSRKTVQVPVRTLTSEAVAAKKPQEVSQVLSQVSWWLEIGSLESSTVARVLDVDDDDDDDDDDDVKSYWKCAKIPTVGKE